MLRRRRRRRCRLRLYTVYVFTLQIKDRPGINLLARGRVRSLEICVGVARREHHRLHRMHGRMRACHGACPFYCPQLIFKYVIVVSVCVCLWMRTHMCVNSTAPRQPSCVRPIYLVHAPVCLLANASVILSRSNNFPSAKCTCDARMLATH